MSQQQSDQKATEQVIPIVTDSSCSRWSRNKARLFLRWYEHMQQVNIQSKRHQNHAARKQNNWRYDDFFIKPSSLSIYIVYFWKCAISLLRCWLTSSATFSITHTKMRHITWAQKDYYFLHEHFYFLVLSCLRHHYLLQLMTLQRRRWAKSKAKPNK